MKDNKTRKHLKYTNKEYIYKIKRLKYKRLLDNYRKKRNITEEEKKLTSYNSRSCDYEKFKKFIEIKNSVNKFLLDEYKYEIFRKYK